MTPARYGELRAAVIAAGYGDEIEWAQGLQPPSCGYDLACEAIWVILNSGMRYRIARRIWERLKPHLDGGGPAGQVFGHKGKAAAIDAIWGRCDELLEAFRAAEDKVAWCQTLPWIGPITKFHLAKNLGVDCAKPDRHLERIAVAAGLDVHGLCAELAAASGDRVATVDMVLWRAAEIGLIRTRSLETTAADATLL